MLDYKKDALVMVAEYCMSFGISPASNIAQRLAILIVEVVKKNFDEEEERYAEECNHPGFQQWRQTRRMLSSKTGRNEARCYFLEMYTDDPLGGILGAQRMKRFIVCWTRCTRRMRLKMAIAVKRQLGCSAKWIGARYHNVVGIVVIPKDKRVKAMHDLLKLIEGSLNCEELKKLNGLLEWCAVVKQLKRNWMAGMYEPFQAGREAEWGGETLPWVSKLMRQSAWAWVTDLSVGCAAPVSAALPHRQIMQFEDSQPFKPGTTLYGITSDASKEGATIPGIGGYFAGLWWSIALEDRLWWFDVPALELMGFGINLIVFGKVLQQLTKSEHTLVVAFIDAQASPQLLLKGGTIPRG